MRARPTSVTVFAVLNMVFGGLGLLGTLFTVSMRRFADSAVNQVVDSHAFLSAWQSFGMIAGVLVSLALIGMGTALLGLKPWARKACVAYGVYGVVMSLASLVVAWRVMRPALKTIQGALSNSWWPAPWPGPPSPHCSAWRIRWSWVCIWRGEKCGKSLNRSNRIGRRSSNRPYISQ